MRFGRWTVAIDGDEIPGKELIGGKACSIANIKSLGLHTSPAFVVTSEACTEFMKKDELPDGLEDELKLGLAWLEKLTGRTFGCGPSPLLVSVRSGAAISMPGMMDTVLNLGINNETESALMAESGDKHFARDIHRRFYEMFSHTVLKATIPPLSSEDSTETWDEVLSSSCDSKIPGLPFEQLMLAVTAVFESWNSRRAKRYRKHNGIPDCLGTAVTVQSMVFGNMDETSGTGVLFSRNPLTGDNIPYGEYLHRAQGEDVVSGKFDPKPLSYLQSKAPDIYDELMVAARALEQNATDVQDIEFTIQQGKLFILQTRSAKRSPAAAVRFAVDMVDEGFIDEDTAISRVTAEQVRSLLNPRLDHERTGAEKILATGEPACHGVGTGVVVSNCDEAETLEKEGEAVILARPTTSPEDVHGMISSRAVITEQGGATSHAAVVCRALGTPCIVGCGVDTVTTIIGQEVTVDGIEGKVYAGILPVVIPDERDDVLLAKLAEWAVSRSPLTVIRKGDEEPNDILDLDKISGGEDPEQLPTLIAGYKSAKGGAISSDAGIEAALKNGLKIIVAEHVLPAMLAAIHADQNVNL